MNLKNLLIVGFMLLTSIACKATGKGNKGVHPSPPAIIYKTKADYYKNVAITLSKNKSKIISYPAPQDVYYHGKLAYPTVLNDGFLLDNRGIGPNSAFIKLTYEEYSKLSQAPSADELYKMIIDKKPFKKMYSLGNRNQYKDEVSEINQLIEQHKLKKFKKLK